MRQLRDAGKRIWRYMGNAWKTIAVFATVAFFITPIFRSGMRGGLTGWEWIVNHSIFGPKVEYVPAEAYLDIFKGKGK